MINGIKTLIDGDHCVYCDAIVFADKYNFCPKCGNALNLQAARALEQKEKKAKLEVLDELAYEIKDVDALKVILEKTKSL